MSLPDGSSQNIEVVAEENAESQDLVDHAHGKHDSVVDTNRFTTAKKLIVCCDGENTRPTGTSRFG